MSNFTIKAVPAADQALLDLMTAIMTEWRWHIYRCGTNKVIDHYNDIIMSTMAFQITSPMIVYSPIYSGADQRKHQSSTSLAFV